MPLFPRADHIAARLLPGMLLVLVLGCQSATPVAEKSAAVPQRSTAVVTIRETTEYRKALDAFSAGNRAEARKILTALSEKPGLSRVDKQFLQTQIALCDTSKKLSNSPSSSPPKISPHLVDCGPRALVIAAQRLGAKADLEQLRRAAGTSENGTSLAGLEKAAKSVGLKAEAVQVDRDALAQFQMPAVAWLDGDHFVALLKIDRESARLRDPNDLAEKEMPLTELLARSGGIVLSLKKG